MERGRQGRRSRAVRRAGSALVLALAAGAPSCLLPELVVETDGGAGADGSSQTGGTASIGGSPSGGEGNGETGGAESAGSGGRSSGGAPGSGGGSSGGVPGSGGESSEPNGGYYESGRWHGKVSALESDTVEPSDFDSTLGSPYCVLGTIIGADAGEAAAGWAWNLNQEATCTGTGCLPASSPIEPEGEGITILIDNREASPLRLELEGPSAIGDETDTWCVELGAATGTIFVPWTSFDTQCWQGGSGEAYEEQDIERLTLYVPDPGEGDSIDVDLCVWEVAEDGPPVSGCASADQPGLGTHSLTGTQSARVLRGSHGYVVHNNLWQASSGQRIDVLGASFEVVEESDLAQGAFPAVFVGNRLGIDTGATGLPRSIGDFATPTMTRFSWSGDLGTSAAAVVIEALFTEDPNDVEPPVGALQLWLASSAGVVPPGEEVGPSSNSDWTIFSGGTTEGGVPLVVLKATMTVTQFAEDLQFFVGEAGANGITVDYLTSIAAGFQISDGGEDLTVVDFCSPVHTQQ